jgi:nucleotide-binding universal stress UspA family protein
VVGVDGSSQAVDALALASTLANGTGAGLMLAYIYNKEPTAEDQDRYYRRQLKDRAASILRPSLELLPEGIDAESGAFPSTTTAHGLRDMAIDVNADLIVLGSTHYGPVGRVLIGSVGELLCSDAPCAVVVAPRGLGDGRSLSLKSIGVAFDGSDQSRGALVEALTLADAFDAELTVLTVVKSGRFPLNRGARKADAQSKAQLSELLEEIEPRAQVEHLISRGDPVERLSEAAEGFDLLVVGSRRFGPIRHTLLGGVSGKLMRVAPCPVVVVPVEQPADESGKPPTSWSHS